MFNIGREKYLVFGDIYVIQVVQIYVYDFKKLNIKFLFQNFDVEYIKYVLINIKVNYIILISEWVNIRFMIININ